MISRMWMVPLQMLNPGAVHMAALNVFARHKQSKWIRFW